jgi:hypothetical protein
MWLKWWLAGTVFTLQLIGTSEEVEESGEEEEHQHSVLCRSCGREVADPGLLYTRVLSPEFLERRNLSRLFGSRQPVSVERLRNPAGREFQVVSFTKAGQCNHRTGIL